MNFHFKLKKTFKILSIHKVLNLIIIKKNKQHNNYYNNFNKKYKMALTI